MSPKPANEMKHAISIIAFGLLHIIPPTCIAILASNPSEMTAAITVCILFFATLGLGYWHGHERTWSTRLDLMPEFRTLRDVLPKIK